MYQSPVIDADYSLKDALLGSQAPSNILNQLSIVDVDYYSFDGLLHKGQLVIHEKIIDDVTTIFKQIKEKKFPIQSVIPIVQFDWDDSISLLNNNTSAFNYRPVVGINKKLSDHSYGLAVDINPVQNPYIKKKITLPPNATYDLSVLGTMYPTLFINQSFQKLGWQWGGNWTSLKDYQHFEKPSVLQLN